MEALRASFLGERMPGEVPTTFWLPDSTPKDPTLCVVCRRLNVRALVNPPPMTLDLANLGRYIDIRDKSSHCRFCKLIVSVITTSWNPVINWDACDDLDHTEVGLDNNLHVQVWPVPRDAEEAAKKTTAATIATGSVCIDVLKEDASKLGLDGSSIFCGHSRVVPKEVADVGRMMEWIQICEEHHGNKCGKEIADNKVRIPTTMRVIDVDDMCLVPVSPSTSMSSLPPSGTKGRARYVTLSYVWGNIASVDSYKTTTSNFQQRTLKRGLLSVPFPRTIRDAILTTRRLGERYLWVDAVCIIQDSPSDRASQISSMNLIYGAATLTIVAAGGTDAESPLPRSHPGSPHKITQSIVPLSDGTRFTLPLKRLWDLEHTVLLTPRWFSRGWTFQERELSVRMLVFTKEQVYFQCRCAGFAEDKAFEQQSSNGKPIPASRPAANSLRRMQKADTFMSKYYDLVEGYSERNLGDDSDALNAFVGVGNVLTELYGARFTLSHGLPGPELESALLWHPANAGSMVRRPDFPSWSWAGWRGKVVYTPDPAGLDRRVTIEHVIPEFHLHLNGPHNTVARTGSTIILPGPTAGKRRTLDRLIQNALKPSPIRIRDITKFPYIRFRDIPMAHKPRSPPKATPPGTLEFLAPVAPATSFDFIKGDFHLPDCQCSPGRHLQQQLQNTPLSQSPLKADFACRIVDKRGVTCGMLGGVFGVVDINVRHHSLTERRALVCLRRAGVRMGRAYDCPVFDTKWYHNESLGCLDVLLVEYSQDGVAERVAAGRIHEDAWIQAMGLSWDKVWLR